MVVALSHGAVAASCEKAESDYTHRKCCVVAWVPYWDQKSAAESFRKNAAYIDYLVMFWYHLDPEGKIRKYKYAKEDRELIQLAKDNNIKVFALIANLPDNEFEGEGKDWDAHRVHHVIANEKKRKKHISEIISLLDKMQFDGVNIDYEALTRNMRGDFSAFIRELAQVLHERGDELAVSLHPKTGEFKSNESNGSEGQDWSEIMHHADQLHLMTYTQHTLSSGPGPVAALDWIEPVLDYAVNDIKIPVEKLFLGVALYGQAWRKRTLKGYKGLDLDLTYEKVNSLKARYKAHEKWNEIHASPTLRFEDKRGREHIVWYENKKSFQRKLHLAKRFEICHLGLWRIGGEDERIWSELCHQGYGNSSENSCR